MYCRICECVCNVVGSVHPGCTTCTVSSQYTKVYVFAISVCDRSKAGQSSKLCHFDSRIFLVFLLIVDRRKTFITTE